MARVQQADSSDSPRSPCQRTKTLKTRLCLTPPKRARMAFPIHLAQARRRKAMQTQAANKHDRFPVLSPLSQMQPLIRIQVLRLLMRVLASFCTNPSSLKRSSKLNSFPLSHRPSSLSVLSCPSYVHLLSKACCCFLLGKCNLAMSRSHSFLFRCLDSPLSDPLLSRLVFGRVGSQHDSHGSAFNDLLEW